MRLQNIFDFLKNNPLIFLIFILVIGHISLDYEDLFVTGHSRLQTLTKILSMSHEKFYYQIEKGIPMDIVWEDPFMGFLLSTAQLFLSSFGSYKIGIQFIYFVQFFFLISIFIKPFLEKIYHLPNYLKYMLPVFFLASVDQNIIFYSWNGYWAQNLFIICICLYLISYINLYFSNNINLKKIFYSSIYSCLILACLSLIRRNIYFEATLIFTFFFLILIFLKGFKINYKFFFLSILPITFFLFSYFFINLIIKTTWEWRDSHYNITIEKRNPTHPLWVPLYAGLGQVKNNLGIKFDDGSVYWNLKKMFPNFEIDKNYGSQAYEKKVKKMYLTTIKNNPELFLNSVLKKILIISKDNKEILLLIILMLLNFNLIQKSMAINLLAGSTVFSTSIVPVLTSTFFQVSFKSALWFWISFFIFRLLKEAYSNFYLIKSNKFFIKFKKIAYFVNSNLLFNSFKKIVLKVLLLILLLFSILFVIFLSFDKFELVPKKNKVDFQLNWTTEEDKFFSKNMEQNISDIKLNQFDKFIFRIDNKKNNLKYLKIKINSDSKISSTIKKINFYDYKNLLIKEVNFKDPVDLNFFSPSGNRKKMTYEGLKLSHSKSAKSDTIKFLEENISPYNNNIPEDLHSISITLRVANDFEPNFYQWLRFLISYN